MINLDFLIFREILYEVHSKRYSSIRNRTNTSCATEEHLQNLVETHSNEETIKSENSNQSVEEHIETEVVNNLSRESSTNDFEKTEEFPSDYQEKSINNEVLYQSVENENKQIILINLYDVGDIQTYHTLSSKKLTKTCSHIECSKFQGYKKQRLVLCTFHNFKIIILLDSWTSLRVQQTECLRWFSCTVHNKNLYIFGGNIVRKKQEKIIATVQVFDHNNNIWKDVTSMNVARR